MEVILDSNFIISCVLRRIDFIEQLEGMGFKIRLPVSVMQELKDLKTDEKTSRAERQAIDVATGLLKESGVKKIRIGGKYADEGLIKKGNEGYYIATLDREIKRKVPNKVIIASAQNKLTIERS